MVCYVPHCIVRTSISRIWSSSNTRHSRPFFFDNSGNFTLPDGVCPVVALGVTTLAGLVMVDFDLRLDMALGRSNPGCLPRCSLENTAFYPATLGRLDMNSCRLDLFQ